jgi:hypothetical protein
MKFVKSLLLLVFILNGNFVYALSELGQDQSLIDQINDTFYVEGELSAEKIEAFRNIIQTRADQISRNITIYDTEIKDKKKVKLKKDLFTYNLIFKYLDELPSYNDIEARTKIKKILDLDFATKMDGKGIPIVSLYETIKSFSKNYSFSKEIIPSKEASNLVDPQTGLFYEKSELEQLKLNGVDFSLIEPSSKSELWTQQDIENVDVEEAYTGGQSKYFDGLLLNFPKNKAVFKKVRKTQTKPKVDIIVKNNGIKEVFKLKFGAEMHSEITAGSLAAALGFHFDTSKYVRDFKMVLPKKMKLKHFKREWNSYFIDYDVDKYIKSVGKTKKGKTYIIFHEALIEAKPKDIIRVGQWAWGKNGNRGLREARGLLLYNMWISNLDLKESGNNKLALRKNADGNYDYYYYQHDLGFSFGRYFREKPIDFYWNPIHSATRDYVRVNFRSFQNNSGFDHVSYSDARWMIRKIAKLSRTQIETAVELGGWPNEIGALLTEKLISRRNHFIRAFDLSSDFVDIPFNAEISTKNNVLVKGELKKTIFSGYTQNFDQEYNEVLRPIYSGLESLAVQGALKLTSNFDTVEFDSETLGYDSSLIGGVSVSFDREVERNLKQKGDDDAFITQDTMKITYKLGLGVLVKGNVSYTKEYKIIYPVRTEREGIYHDNFIFNVLLPYDIRKGKLPENYVLVLSDRFEGGGEIILNVGTTPISVGLEKSFGNMNRTVIAKKNKVIKIFKDKTNFNSLNSSIYADLLFLRLPVLKNSEESGVLGRSIYKLRLDKGEREAKLRALDDVLRDSDLKSVKELSEKFELRSNYVLERTDINIFAMFDVEDKKRVDDLSYVIYDKSGVASIEKYLQVDIDESTEWNFLGDGELKKSSFQLIGKVTKKGKVKNPSLEVKLVIEDVRTTSKELGDHYINLINKLALSTKFLTFDPKLFSRNGEWGSTNTFINLEYDKKAIDKLLNTPEDEFYRVMSKFSNRDIEFWKSRKKGNTPHKAHRLKRKYQRFVKNIISARAEENQLKRYEQFVDAMSGLIWKENHSFNYLLFQRINYIVGSDGFYLEGLITMPEDKEMRLPAKTPLYNVMNKELHKKSNFFEFDFREPEEAWDVLY